MLFGTVVSMAESMHTLGKCSLDQACLQLARKASLRQQLAALLVQSCVTGLASFVKIHAINTCLQLHT